MDVIVLPAKKMSKLENKKYREAKKRLEKSQSKYTTGFTTRGKEVQKASRSSRSAAAKRWSDWRLTDGQESPVITYKLEDIE